MKKLLSMLVAAGIATTAALAPHPAQAHVGISFGIFAPASVPAVYVPPPQAVYIQTQPVVYREPVYGRLVCNAYGRCYRQEWRPHAHSAYYGW